MSLTTIPPLEIQSWTEETLSNLTAKISKDVSKPLIFIDGAAGSGKTTLAVKFVERLNANLVHTDDVSWFADPVHWDHEMLDGIVTPWLNGKNVAYQPSGWIKENRSGSIEVDSNRALIIEGMGACRKTLRDAATFSIWVDADPEVAREGVVQRDLANGENGATVESVIEFADWWDSQLIPLLLEEKSWEYADIIVNGVKSDFHSNILLVHVPGAAEECLSHGDRAGIP